MISVSSTPFGTVSNMRASTRAQVDLNFSDDSANLCGGERMRAGIWSCLRPHCYVPITAEDASVRIGGEVEANDEGVLGSI
jgi:hypothetical protein